MPFVTFATFVGATGPFYFVYQLWVTILLILCLLLPPTLYRTVMMVPLRIFHICRGHWYPLVCIIQIAFAVNSCTKLSSATQIN